MISISKRELFIKSWELFKNNSQLFFNIGILLFTVQHMVPIMLGVFFVPYSVTYFIFHFAYLLLTTGISLWVVVQILKVLRSQQTDSFMEILKYFPLVFRAIGGSFIVTFTLVSIGLIIFTLFSDQMAIDFETATLEVILGAITSSTFLSIIAMGYLIGVSYLWVKAYFFIYYIIDDNASAFSAIQNSLKATNGYEADLFIVWIATVIMNFIGILLYGIGLMLTLPYTLIVLSSFYHQYLSTSRK
tara:strand:+ start:2988 stop:3722 length:735 start_codon:yes stop_codon:yes gene_type:complete